MDESSEDEDGEQWAIPLERNDETKVSHQSPVTKSPVIKSTNPVPVLNTNVESPYESEQAHGRTVIQIDIDCFYAQVEMIRNPELRDKPLGIQQKYIVVTCNYKARDFGVTKLMSLKDAKEKCPQLILVSGEDLTNYRDMSYKITEVLQKFSPVVERLGFDENFLDVTSLVESRLKGGEGQKPDKIEGYVYGTTDKDPTDVREDDANSCGCGCHLRLSIGSQIALNIRQTLYKELGITCCAGIAHNKLMAKLVGAVNKPNKQTTLLPENTVTFMRQLGSVGKIPGIGYASAKKLAGLGIITISDLQGCSIEKLLSEFDHGQSMRMIQLSYGVDETAVKLTGQPQSISDEDSFKKCSTENEAKEKILELLDSLLIRLHEDGRTPQTVRLTIRKFTTVNKYGNRESRQCAIPAYIFGNFAPDYFLRIKTKLFEVLMQLFYKLVDIHTSFHLTLINVCFTKLMDNSKNKIKSFFQAVKGIDKTPGEVKDETSNNETSAFVEEISEDFNEDNSGFVNSRKRLFSPTGGADTVSKKSRTKTKSCEGFKSGNSQPLPTVETLQKSMNRLESVPDSVQTNIPDADVPTGMDVSIFRSLPLEIQQELLHCGELRDCYTEQSDKLIYTPKIDSTKKQVISGNNNSGQQKLDNLCQKFNTGSRQHMPARGNDFYQACKPSTQINDTSGIHSNPANSCLHSKTVSSKENGTVCYRDSMAASLSPEAKHKTQSPFQNLTPIPTAPPNVDMDVFTSLPKELQEELFLDWRLKNGAKSSKKQNPNGILKYYQKKS